MGKCLKMLCAKPFRELLRESAKKVAKESGIPRTTIRRKVSIITKNPQESIATNFSKAQVFNHEEEKDLAEFLSNCSAMFYGLTTKGTRKLKLAYEMALINKKKMPAAWIQNEEAGEEWLRGFLRRQKNLSIRKPEATSLARSTAFNHYNINAFFDLLQSKYEQLQIEGRQILNLDETGFTTVQKIPKIVASKGIKQVGQVTSRERGELVTVCAIVSAIGIALPPVFVFPRKKFQNHMLHDAPEGSLGLVSDSGWMTRDLFPIVVKHIVKHAQPSESNPIVLIFDNHESHLCLKALLYAEENHIHIITLVPHTSNKMQPLDIAVFGPVKSYFYEEATSWMMRNPGKTITIHNIASLVGPAWMKGATPNNITSGFKNSGIWPFNRTIFPEYFFAPAEVTNRPLSEPAEGINRPLLEHAEVTNQSLAEPAETTNQPLTAAVSSAHIDKSLSESEFTSQEEIISPFILHRQFFGYPKAAPRIETARGRKKGRSMEATSSPNIKALIDATKENEKKNLEPKSKKKKAECHKTLRFENWEEKDLVDDESDLESFSDPNSDDESDPTRLILGKVDTVSIGDFVLCEYNVKKSTVFYVGKVTKIPHDVEVKFFRKSSKIKGKFIQPQVEDIASVPIGQIKAKLTRSTIGTTERTKNSYFFVESLGQLNIH